jgi:uncharacterized membrane protein YdjX (TVP38/TMEM64 family)
MWVRRLLGVVAAAALLSLLWVVWDRSAVLAWMQHARPAPYFVVMALLTGVGAPPTPFFIVAGATFGVRVGLIGSGLALASSLTLSYWIARGSLRSLLQSVLKRFGHDLPDFGEPGKDAVRFTLMVKLAPGVPAVLKNYGLAVAGVPFPLFLGSGMLITGVYGAALVVLGESLLEHDFGRALLPAAVVAAVAALGLWWWRRRRGRPGRRGEERAHAPPSGGTPIDLRH